MSCPHLSLRSHLPAQHRFQIRKARGPQDEQLAESVTRLWASTAPSVCYTVLPQAEPPAQHHSSPYVPHNTSFLESTVVPSPFFPTSTAHAYHVCWFTLRVRILVQHQHRLFHSLCQLPELKGPPTTFCQNDKREGI